jgi:DNA replication and repair protein RecF
MALHFLEAHRVRLITHARCNLHPSLNLITGANASGKTSLLEAVYLLGSGKSFRSAQPAHVIQHGAASLTVFGRVSHRGQMHSLGLEREGAARRVRVDEKPETSAAALAARLPVQVLAPETHYAFLGVSSERRAALNWGVFHVEQDFYGHWQRYQRLLKQRNAALKGAGEIGVWDVELAALGEKIHDWRERYLATWNERFGACALALTGLDVRLDLQRGWRQDQALAEALRADCGRDREAGFTHSGPHRADVVFRGQSGGFRYHYSHGQQKLLVTAARLTQLELLAETGEVPVLLIDDLAAELDRAHRAAVLARLAGLGIQSFITATEESEIDLSPWPDHAKFHVEQGVISAL